MFRNPKKSITMDCKMYARLPIKDSEKVDDLIKQGFAFNRSDFVRLAIKRYIMLCEEDISSE